MRKLLFLCLVMFLLLVTLEPLTIVKVGAEHQSRVYMIGTYPPKDCSIGDKQLWIYGYVVKHNSTKLRDFITSVRINKTAHAKIAMRKEGEWDYKDEGEFFTIYKPKSRGIAPPGDRRFYIASRQNPADAFAYTNDTEGFVFGPHLVKAPDTKPHWISQGFPEGEYIHRNKFYNYTLTWISGNVDYFWLILELGVIVENVVISNPEWQWYHDVEEGLLLFDTTTNPLNETNPQVSMRFSSSNSIVGEVGALVNGFGDQILGPVLPPVGGIYIPVNKLSLLAPYIGLTILLAAAVVTVGYVKKRKQRWKD